MMKMNKCEAEIDAIRLKLYEETKHMTPEERGKRISERARKAAEKYGFNIVKSASDKK